MTILVRFMIAATIVFIIADVVPFPNYPSGYIATTINQHNQNQKTKWLSRNLFNYPTIISTNLVAKIPKSP